MDQIVLKNMAFYGNHGNFDAETKLGQRFFIDVVLSVDVREAGQTDDLTKTIDYGLVYDHIRAIVEGRTYRLLERVATVIIEDLLTAFDGVHEVTLSIRKPAAPIRGILDYAEVTLTRGRS